MDKILTNVSNDESGGSTTKNLLFSKPAKIFGILPNQLDDHKISNSNDDSEFSKNSDNTDEDGAKFQWFKHKSKDLTLSGLSTTRDEESTNDKIFQQISTVIKDNGSSKIPVPNLKKNTQNNLSLVENGSHSPPTEESKILHNLSTPDIITKRLILAKKNQYEKLNKSDKSQNQLNFSFDVDELYEEDDLDQDDASVPYVFSPVDWDRIRITEEEKIEQEFFKPVTSSFKIKLTSPNHDESTNNSSNDFETNDFLERDTSSTSTKTHFSKDSRDTEELDYSKDSEDISVYSNHSTDDFLIQEMRANITSSDESAFSSNHKDVYSSKSSAETGKNNIERTSAIRHGNTYNNASYCTRKVADKKKRKSFEKERTQTFINMFKEINSKLASYVEQCIPKLPRWQAKFTPLTAYLEEQQSLDWYHNIIDEFTRELNIFSSELSYENEIEEYCSNYAHGQRVCNSYIYRTAIIGPRLSGKSTLMGKLAQRILMDMILNGGWKRTFVMCVNSDVIKSLCDKSNVFLKYFSDLTINFLLIQRPIIRPFKHQFRKSFRDAIEGRINVPKCFTTYFRHSVSRFREILNFIRDSYSNHKTRIPLYLNIATLPVLISKAFDFQKVMLFVDHYDVLDFEIDDNAKFEDEKRPWSIHEIFSFLLNSSDFIVTGKDSVHLLNILKTQAHDTMDLSRRLSVLSTLDIIDKPEYRDTEVVCNIENELIKHKVSVNDLGGCPLYLSKWTEICTLLEDEEDEESHAAAASIMTSLLNGIYILDKPLYVRSLNIKKESPPPPADDLLEKYIEAQSYKMPQRRRRISRKRSISNRAKVNYNKSKDVKQKSNGSGSGNSTEIGLQSMIQEHSESELISDPESDQAEDKKKDTKQDVDEIQEVVKSPHESSSTTSCMNNTKSNSISQIVTENTDTPDENQVPEAPNSFQAYVPDSSTKIASKPSENNEVAKDIGSQPSGTTSPLILRLDKEDEILSEISQPMIDFSEEEQDVLLPEALTLPGEDDTNQTGDTEVEPLIGPETNSQQVVDPVSSQNRLILDEPNDPNTNQHEAKNICRDVNNSVLELRYDHSRDSYYVPSVYDLQHNDNRSSSSCSTDTSSSDVLPNIDSPDDYSSDALGLFADIDDIVEKSFSGSSSPDKTHPKDDTTKNQQSSDMQKQDQKSKHSYSAIIGVEEDDPSLNLSLEEEDLQQK